MQRVVPGIIVGGVLGTAVRWATVEHGPFDAGAATVLVNGAGSLVLGWVVARWPRADDPRRLGLGVGFAGGLTTFSALAVDVATSLDTGDLPSAGVTIVANLVTGLFGFAAARHMTRRTVA